MYKLVSMDSELCWLSADWDQKKNMLHLLTWPHVSLSVYLEIISLLSKVIFHHQSLVSWTVICKNENAKQNSGVGACRFLGV